MSDKKLINYPFNLEQEESKWTNEYKVNKKLI
jgi:hypothetical protein